MRNEYGRPAGETRTDGRRPIRMTGSSAYADEPSKKNRKTQMKGLILAQNERWRRGLGMQVE